MSKNLNCAEAKQLSIISYLSEMGIEPHHIKGSDYWYFSPFREENHPSFKVSSRFNLWHDFGEGTGGSIIDLGIRLHQCSVSAFLQKLAGQPASLSFHQPPAPAVSGGEKENKIKIIAASELVSAPLLAYLSGRGIDMNIAREYCREVGFELNGKSYNAIGFPNRSGGYELRNAFFKGSSSPKDLTFIDRGTDSVFVFEGFTDFLSLLAVNANPGNSSFLILNSLSFLSKGLDIIGHHKNSFLFLDQDKAGRLATEKIIQVTGFAVDGSAFYRRFKDLNEYLIDLKKGTNVGRVLKPNHGQEQSRGWRR